MADNLQLGAWEADRVAIEHAAHVDRGDVCDLDMLHRFSIYVARLVCKCERVNGIDMSQPAAFVLVDSRRHANLKKEGRATDSTFSTGVKPLVGRIHFVTEAVTRSVYETFSGSDDQVIFDRLDTLGMQCLPMMVYLPNASGSVLLFLPRGSCSDDERREIALNTVAITEQQIVDAIRLVYDTELKTPDLSQPFPIWEKASHGHPIQEAERGIQKFVRIGLATKFYWCRVAMEQPDKDGRTDLELIDESSGNAGGIVRHAILELKVLRSWGSTGKAYSLQDTNKHVADGVSQAHVYGELRNTVHRLLCCFDMRDKDLGNDATFAHVRDEADTLAVKLYRWFLYRSSEDYRAAVVAANVAAADATMLASAAS